MGATSVTTREPSRALQERCSRLEREGLEPSSRFLCWGSPLRSKLTAGVLKLSTTPTSSGKRVLFGIADQPPVDGPLLRLV
jgi:hypothetical protein